jgi:hypothetical protein
MKKSLQLVFNPFNPYLTCLNIYFIQFTMISPSTKKKWKIDSHFSLEFLKFWKVFFFVSKLIQSIIKSKKKMRSWKINTFCNSSQWTNKIILIKYLLKLIELWGWVGYPSSFHEFLYVFSKHSQPPKMFL